jgi:cytoskeletal protein CcmA (bactofilin family)
MWKRENETAPNPQPAQAPTHSPAPAAAAAASTPAAPRPEPEPPPARSTPSTGASRAVIGPSLDLTGELSGAEDLLVEGKVQGKIRLAQNAVFIGAKGRVSADVQARMIEIEGEVDGHLNADELIVLRKSARVRGDLASPRVVIEDGAKFKGTIDMEPKRAAAAPAGLRPVPAEESQRPAPAGSSAPSTASAATRAS